MQFVGFYFAQCNALDSGPASDSHIKKVLHVLIFSHSSVQKISEASLTPHTTYPLETMSSWEVFQKALSVEFSSLVLLY
ncbi:hypothetical protein AGIG_G17088 [Arapaima gigas]